MLSLCILCSAVFVAALPQKLSVRQALQPFELQSVTSYLLSQQYTIEFNFTDPNTGNRAICQTAWAENTAAPSYALGCSDSTFGFKLDPFVGVNNFTLDLYHWANSLAGSAYLYGSVPWEPPSGPLSCVVPQAGEGVCSAKSVSVSVSVM
ncbi:hypothetical protein MPDQ_001157 [Monascus purpureus]|uniref:AA1-like domain-containing protein n=1 Tax=Monascus purpureus TaxID=5098 RepID=A0A507R5T3_MONPU|nr:hypothetical protein MPDQ_001157 [Monascus purpureus]